MGESIQVACYFMQSTQLNFTLSIRDAYQNEEHRLNRNQLPNFDLYKDKKDRIKLTQILSIFGAKLG